MTATVTDLNGKTQALRPCARCGQLIYWSSRITQWVHHQPGAWLYCPKAGPPTVVMA
jgi:hypothetical protein